MTKIQHLVRHILYLRQAIPHAIGPQQEAFLQQQLGQTQAELNTLRASANPSITASERVYEPTTRDACIALTEARHA